MYGNKLLGIGKGIFWGIICLSAVLPVQAQKGKPLTKCFTTETPAKTLAQHNLQPAVEKQILRNTLPPLVMPNLTDEVANALYPGLEVLETFVPDWKTRLSTTFALPPQHIEIIQKTFENTDKYFRSSLLNSNDPTAWDYYNKFLDEYDTQLELAGQNMPYLRDEKYLWTAKSTALGFTLSQVLCLSSLKAFTNQYGVFPSKETFHHPTEIALAGKVEKLLSRSDLKTNPLIQEMRRMKEVFGPKGEEDDLVWQLKQFYQINKRVPLLEQEGAEKELRWKINHFIKEHPNGRLAFWTDYYTNLPPNGNTVLQ